MNIVHPLKLGFVGYLTWMFLAMGSGSALAAEPNDSPTQPSSPPKRTKPKSDKPLEPPTLKPKEKQPGVWEKMKKGMGQLVPEPVKRGWEDTKRKWEQAKALYEAMKKFAGWDEETLRKQRQVREKQMKKEGWQRADEDAEKEVIASLRMVLWTRACRRGSSRACTQWSRAEPKNRVPLEFLRDIYRHRKLWKRVLPLCDQLRKMPPTGIEDQLCYGEALVGTKQIQQAIELYRSLSQTYPLVGMVWLSLGRLLLEPPKQTPATPGAPPAPAKPAPKASPLHVFLLAEAACRQAAERMPKEALAHHCLGEAFERQKKRKEASASYTTACDLEHIPACVKVRELRPQGLRGAWIWSKMNTRINALRVAQITRVNSCRIGIKRACRSLARSYREEAKQLALYQRLSDAEARLREGTRIAPFDAEAWRALGRFLHRKKQAGAQEEACQLMQRSLAIDAKQPALWHLLGQCHQRKAKYTLKKAHSALSKACALGDNRACMLINFGKDDPK